MGKVLAVLAVVCLSVGGRGARADDPAARLDDDQKLLWEAALAIHDGFLYTYTERTFPTEESARVCHDERFIPSCSGASASVKQENTPAAELPSAVRERVRALEEGDMSPPFPTADGLGWRTVELHDRGVARAAPGLADPAGWLAGHAAETLPTAQALRTDPALRVRRALDRIRTPAALEAALAAREVAPGDLDQRASDGATVLLHAVEDDSPELAEAVLARGASPDACGVSICPLAKAVKYRRDRLVPVLLAHRAKPDGADPTRVSPLMWAAYEGDCDQVRQLLAAGADPLRRWPERTGHGPARERTLLYFTPDEEHAQCTAELVEIVHQALARRGTYRWSAWIEQGKTRVPVKDGATIPVARAPFRLVYRVAKLDSAFRVAASPDPALLERARAFRFRRMLVHGMRIGAASPDAKWLSVKGIAPLDAADPLDSLEFTTTEIGYWDDPEVSFGTTKRTRAGVVELVHQFEELITDDGEVPIADYQGKVIAVVMGPVPWTGGGGEFFEAARFTLRFR